MNEQEIESVVGIKIGLHKKLQLLMYYLTKHAARDNYHAFLDSIGISYEEYQEIKQIWKDRLYIEPYV